MRRRPGQPERRNDDEMVHMPKYTIGIVSQLLHLPPQMLRRYEEAGLLEPARQSGKNRLYSDYDISILEEIVELANEGINANGIRYILHMRQEIHVLRRQVGEAHENPDETLPATDR
jgi:MerR family transcriptional regulator, heat shock protein HspR